MPRVALSSRLAIGALALALGFAATAPAQPVVQQLPSGESRALNAALARVAANPRDANALIDAGNAALNMNDIDAAIGFFTRATQVAPGDPRAAGGLAAAHLRNEDPYTAISLFNDAERFGPLSSAQLTERGLAYDLVGDNATAQRYYRLAGPNNDEAVRRLSLSLAISGDRRGSEAALSPLMVRQDKSAWRTRAFSLAILGDETQAVSIANATMPAALAGGIAPYLRYMRQLTRAQQAAAANLGHVPRASEIGRDDPRVAQYSPPTGRNPATGPDAGLIPAGQPLGTSAAARAKGTLQAARPTREERRRQERQARADQQRPRDAERVRPPEPVVAVSTTPPEPSTLALSRRAAQPSAPPPAPVPASRPMLATASPAVPAPAAVPSRPPITPVPGFTLAPSAPLGSPASSPPVLPPATVAPPPAAPVRRAEPPRPRSLAEAFGDIGRPAASIVPAPGAVDIRRVAPPRPAAAKPAVPAHPSRVWVQLATGRHKQALGFDWRRMTKDDAAVFRARKPHVTAWGQTNRLLTGPFETEAAANAFLAQLRRADVDGAFLWTSPAGQIVDALPVAK
jgi:tetratricopeptide (TPR) repeat protein